MAAQAVDTALLDLYKLSVEMADRTSARRLTTNAFFVTISSALIAFAGILSVTSAGSNKGLDSFSLIAVAVAGIISSVAWWALLRYYRRLNSAKFAVITSMESSLPVKPFTDEWKVLQQGSLPRPGSPLRWYQFIERLQGNKHREATVVEQTVPFLFAALNVALVARVIFP